MTPLKLYLEYFLLQMATLPVKTQKFGQNDVTGHRKLAAGVVVVSVWCHCGRCKQSDYITTKVNSYFPVAITLALRKGYAIMPTFEASDLDFPSK